MAVTAGALAAGTLGAGMASGVTTFVNWPQYLFSSGHTSENAAAKTITTANAASVEVKWKFSPAAAPIPGLGGFFASPTVYNGVVYIGARNGHFYAINDSTGAVVWDRFIGFVKPTTCGPEGFTSTATVKKDPTSGKPTVYVYGATGYLYAMDAATGKNVFPKAAVGIPSTTVNDYYAWASPLVYGGNIYVAVSSQCDTPLVRGGMKEFSQKTGALEHTYWSTPTGSVGASIWSSPGAFGKSIFVTTATSALLKIVGYLSGLSSPSVTATRTMRRCSPRSYEDGQTRFPTFSMNRKSSSPRSQSWSAVCTIAASR